MVCVMGPGRPWEHLDLRTSFLDKDLSWCSSAKRLDHGDDTHKLLQSVAASSFGAAIPINIICSLPQAVGEVSERRAAPFQTCHDLRRGAQLQHQLWLSSSYVTSGVDRALIAPRGGTAASMESIAEAHGLHLIQHHMWPTPKELSPAPAY